MPQYKKTFCSQCGAEFGPGDHGYSHCDQHQPAGRAFSNWYLGRGADADGGEAQRVAFEAGWDAREECAKVPPLYAEMRHPMTIEPTATQIETVPTCNDSLQVRLDTIEECAKTAEDFRDGNPDAWDGVNQTAMRIFQAIRCLKTEG